MVAYFIDWLSLLGRWLHFIVGIAWIGSSFYFVWLNNHLGAPENADKRSIDPGVSGELWSVHGGAFYLAQKYGVAPAALPRTLHWFYWEAYSTFLSGFFLLCLMYYGQAELYLIDPAVAPLSKPAAIAIGLAFIVGGWLVYDGLCRTPLARNGTVLGCVLGVLFAAAAWGLCSLFSGRGAFIQFGAMMGTIMVANVFFVIIPGQRGMVQAMQEGREPDPQLGLKGRLRSNHNTFFTLPVLFTMISNHYAMTFGAKYNWLVLIAMTAAGALIRVYFVSRHFAHGKGQRAPLLPAAIAVALLAAVIVALSPSRATGVNAAMSRAAAAAQFGEIQAIVAKRCAVCHTSMPVQGGVSAPPAGVRLDGPEFILLHTARMEKQLATRAMPVGNATGMTDEERAQVLAWIRNGSPH